MQVIEFNSQIERGKLAVRLLAEQTGTPFVVRKSAALPAKADKQK